MESDLCVTLRKPLRTLRLDLFFTAKSAKNTQSSQRELAELKELVL